MPPANYKLHDPELTEQGEDQCRELRAKLIEILPGYLDVGLVLVSPMKRTVQTALIALDWLLEKGVRISAHASWQETTNHWCDIGSPTAELQDQFPAVDFSKVDPVYPDKTSPYGRFYEWSRPALLARGQACLKDLHDRPEPVILVVSHSGFLTKAVSGCAFGNADYRIFDFEQRLNPDDPYRLKERDQTRPLGGMGWSDAAPRVIGDGIPEVAPPLEDRD